MTWHPTDEDLILHFYTDGPAGDRARTGQHLHTCSTCRESWAELTDTLAMVDRAPVPEPGPEFERVVWAHVRAALPPAPPPRRTMRLFAPAFGLATAITVLVMTGATWRLAHPPMPAAADAAADAAGASSLARERVLLTALDSHFEQSEMLLVELLNAPEEDERTLDFERATADDLVASNRLYKVTAEQTGDTVLLRMLEDLESVLVDVARGPDTIDRRDMQTLRARIDDEGLLFRVRAATNEVRGRQQDMLTVSEGPL
jgi:hypothetical protein